ncbi:hypothetical protein BH24ACT12_BH24ACT12_17170 [soil metagenome]
MEISGRTAEGALDAVSEVRVAAIEDLGEQYLSRVTISAGTSCCARRTAPRQLRTLGVGRAPHVQSRSNAARIASVSAVS